MPGASDWKLPGMDVDGRSRGVACCLGGHPGFLRMCLACMLVQCHVMVSILSGEENAF